MSLIMCMSIPGFPDVVSMILNVYITKLSVTGIVQASELEHTLLQEYVLLLVV